ncbi:MAG: energy-coupling factor ABC transporter permease [Anaerolineae bacterium]
MSTLNSLYQPLAAMSAKTTVSAGGLSSVEPVPMHIPDGFLSTPVALLMWIVAIVGVAYALWRVNRELDDRRVPLMGVMAAAIFAGQMLNFSVTGGTSGHLLGAALAAIVLGPWAAVLVMTCVVATQALLFQDGGLLALGANIVNMALVGVAVGYAVYRTVRKLTGDQSWGLFVSGFVAGWLSIVIAALLCALQLALSGTSPANIAVPAMGGIHMLIGVGEGLITAGALAFLYATRRDLLVADKAQVVVSKGLWIGGLAIAILLAILSPLASTHPDGLEWVAEQQGFIEAAREAPYQLIPDYVFPGISNEAVATIVAGILGTLIVFGVTYLVAAGRRRRESLQAR